MKIVLPRWIDIKRIGTILFLVILYCSIIHSDSIAEEYGYLLSDDSMCSIWWAEGMYKIMRDDLVPSEKTDVVKVFAAINEYEPFQLVLHPKKRMTDVRVEVSGLLGRFGNELIPEYISINHVEYVTVTTPTDAYGAAGEWPDPLLPYECPFTAYPGENHPLWITIHVPVELNFGPFDGTITITSGSWKKEISLQLNVWSFILPEETHIRSAFSLNTQNIKLYHNLETQEELETVTDLYIQNFREHRICPTDPLSLYPMKVDVFGVYWEGGEFVSEPVYDGKRALKIVDNSVSSNVNAYYNERIPVEPDVPYKISWFAKTEKEDQAYTVLIKCYNVEGEYLPQMNQLQVYKGSTVWNQDFLEIQGFSPDVKEVCLHIFPAFRNNSGSTTGTAYFDDIQFGPASDDEGYLEGGDFEMNADFMSVEIDFDDFDRAAKRYLDEFGFNSFNLRLQGLGGGTFYSQREGMFGGFRQGTPEYDQLFSEYLAQVQEHLEDNEWLGKEYIYWFDEPNPDDYPFVREGMKNIHKAAPKLTRFITEHRPGPDIMDVSEISCTIFHKVDPEVMADLVKEGREFWSYLCTGPKGPWVTLFTDHPAINLRIWLWMSFKYQLKGILVWSTNYWNSATVFPSGILQNPWEDAMSYRVGYGTPFGQVNCWGNGDGRFLYPPNRHPNNDKRKYMTGPVNSIRWELLREGIEDYEYLWLLENGINNAFPDQKELADKGRELLNFPETFFKNGKEYTKDPKVLLQYREDIARVLSSLIRAYF